MTSPTIGNHRCWLAPLFQKTSLCWLLLLTWIKCDVYCLKLFTFPRCRKSLLIGGIDTVGPLYSNSFFYRFLWNVGILHCGDRKCFWRFMKFPDKQIQTLTPLIRMDKADAGYPPPPSASSVGVSWFVFLCSVRFHCCAHVLCFFLSWLFIDHKLGLQQRSVMCQTRFWASKKTCW